MTNLYRTYQSDIYRANDGDDVMSRILTTLLGVDVSAALPSWLWMIGSHGLALMPASAISGKARAEAFNVDANPGRNASGAGREQELFDDCIGCQSHRLRQRYREFRRT